MTSLDARVTALIDERLMSAYWGAVKHFGTKDLVLVFDYSEKVDPVSAFKREQMATCSDLPETIRVKLGRPASSVATQLKTSEASFWLIVLFPDEEGACMAVNGKIISPAGHA